MSNRSTIIGGAKTIEAIRKSSIDKEALEGVYVPRPKFIQRCIEHVLVSIPEQEQRK
jgi:hypothetical protein